MKKKITTRGIRIWSPSQVLTLRMQQGLALFSGRSMLLSLWYSKLYKVSKREKKTLILHGWESKEQKH